MRALRSYQQPALRYCQRTPCPALFMEMRLGKTLVTIRCLQQLPHGPILVVGPNSALGSWTDELALEGETPVVSLQGASRPRRLKLLFEGRRLTAGRQWYLINQEGHLALPELCAVPWQAVVLDESTFIANPKAKVSRFFTRRFRRVPHRWALTGMPTPENDLQLVQQLIWLDGECLGFKDYWRFRAKCAEPGVFGHRWHLKQDAKADLRALVLRRCHLLTWREAGVKVKKIREYRRLQMPPRLENAYLAAEGDYILEYEGHPTQKTIWGLKRYVWLRRLAGGFVGTDLVWDGKVQEVRRLLTGELAHESVVVWFTFNAELRAVSNALADARKPHGVLVGDTPLEERELLRKRFQGGTLPVLLLQCEVAKLGMTLDTAGAAIYYSEPFGLLGRRQTEDRTISVADRRGVLYVHVLTEGTVDVDIHEANRAKYYRSRLSLSTRLRRLLLERIRS